MNEVPVMDDPLGKHWRQPADIRSAPMDDKHILLTPEQIAGLAEYSSTIPTGVYPGKCWKRIQSDGPLFVWYGPDVGGKCAILFRNILEVTDA